MMRICIGGLTASGKDLIGGLLAKELNVAYIDKRAAPSYKRDVRAKGSKDSLGEKKAEGYKLVGDKKYATVFDEEIATLASKSDCVVTTWMGPWLVKEPTLRIWLNATLEGRARRRATKDKTTVEEAKRMVAEKDSYNAEGFKKLYGIDIMDHSGFDAELNTERLSIEAMVSTIAMLALAKGNKRFE